MNAVATGAPGESPPESVDDAWSELATGFERIVDKYPKLSRSNHRVHLGTLGTGNHFIEICLDETDHVWVMLHSGSRGVGNRIGSYFIALAREDMREHLKNLPDKDLAYFPEGTRHFDDYVEAVGWAQDFARANRDLMMANILRAVRESGEVPPFTADVQKYHCNCFRVAGATLATRSYTKKQSFARS